MAVGAAEIAARQAARKQAGKEVKPKRDVSESKGNNGDSPGRQQLHVELHQSSAQNRELDHLSQSSPSPGSSVSADSPLHHMSSDISENGSDSTRVSLEGSSSPVDEVNRLGNEHTHLPRDGSNNGGDGGDHNSAPTGDHQAMEQVPDDLQRARAQAPERNKLHKTQPEKAPERNRNRLHKERPKDNPDKSDSRFKKYFKEYSKKAMKKLFHSDQGNMAASITIGMVADTDNTVLRDAANEGKGGGG